MTPQQAHDALVTYLKLKVELADWHGVSDAANDLRVLEAEQASNTRQEGCKNGQDG